jgi:hypothetical protein
VHWILRLASSGGKNSEQNPDSDQKARTGKDTPGLTLSKPASKMKTAECKATVKTTRFG